MKKDAKRTYYRNLLNKHKYDIRKTWKVMNTIIGRTRDKTSIPSTFIIDGVEEANANKIGNAFCDYFTNIGKKTADGITPSKHNVEHYMNSAKNRTSMFFTPTDPIEVSKIIRALNSKKSSGHDGLNSILIKSLGDEISLPLTLIINNSLSSGIVPDDMKLAKVVPLFKSKNKQLFTNYRPISLLPVFSKILEKVVHKRLYSFLLMNKILYPRQYGFRHGHSTCDAVLDFTHDMLEALENRESSIGVYLDLSKAFDTLDHGVLLKKLSHYGIRGTTLKWFKSYLINRKQYVLFSGGKSNVHRMPTGVPQGSVLGPLLFIVYTNDIPSVLTHTKAILYADDTTLYASSLNVRDLFEHVTQDLHNLTDWFRANKLSLNTSMTKYMWFNEPNNYYNKENDPLCITLENETLDRVRNTKFLGITIDDSLKWDKHIEYCRKKIAGGIYALNSSKRTLSTEHLKMLYNSIIQPYLTYGNILWGNALQKYIHPLEVQQNKAMRCIYGVKYNASATPLYKRANVLKLKDSHALQLAKLAYCYTCNDLPSPMRKMLEKRSNICNRETRQTFNLVLPKIRTSAARRSFMFECPKVWNAINLQNLGGSKSSFIKHIKAEYIRKYIT